jgi:hypothetical protein
MCYPIKEVNCTEPSPSVSIPCTEYYIGAENTGSLSTVDLLIKAAWFKKNIKNIFNIKRS